MALRRFSFVTGIQDGGGAIQGSGAEWDDTTASFRLMYAGGTWSRPIDGTVQQIQDRYSGNQNYKWTWIDIRAEITAISPMSATKFGGTPITVTGVGFKADGPITLTIGGLPVTDLVVVSDTSITAKTPVFATGGGKPVVISNDNGVFKYPIQFTIIVVPPPTVTAVSPSAGPIAGANPTVTITGTNFLDGATVQFDTGAATAVTVVSDTSITCKPPAHAAGKVDVKVTTAAGVGTKTDAFEYVAVPTVTNISPANGPAAGNTTVTLTGTGFKAPGATAPVFDTTAGTAFNATSDTSATVKTPAHAAGQVDVKFTNAGGTKTVTNGYTYDSATIQADGPTITGIRPTNGPDATEITITGTGFKTGLSRVPRVYAGDVELQSGKLVDSDTSMRVQVTGAGTGSKAIKIVTTNGESNTDKAFNVTA